MVDLPASEPMELAHEFEVDLNCLVMVNHNLTLEGITRSEDEDLSNTGLSMDDEAQRSAINYNGLFYQDLRRAANNLAMVGLMTRLQHWLGRYARQLPGKQQSDKPELKEDLNLLNKCLGDGPVPVTFFHDLVTVRDSVIHADAQAEWEYPVGKRRRVADRYTNYVGGVVDIDEDQVKEAAANAVKQVKWYDEKLYALRGLPRP